MLNSCLYNYCIVILCWTFNEVRVCGFKPRQLKDMNQGASFVNFTRTSKENKFVLISNKTKIKGYCSFSN